ncbi:MAG: porin [Syntrophobacterales bacterium]|nr:porin [Syntrophobacterales bacterium]
MKKLFAAILALGLIVAVSGTASAVDVKFGGSYYVVGVYDDNPSLADSDASYSRAYMFQRIRLQPVFKIAEGLTFTARMDAMEGNWNVDRSKFKSGGGNTGFDWERGYVTFNSGIGKFDVGYQAAGAWGIDWADSGTTRPRVKLTTKVGPMILVAIYEKHVENNALALVDADMDAYYLAAIYPFKGGSAGLLYGYIDKADNRPTPAAFRTTKQILYPYMKATFGSVFVEAELNYIFGKKAEFDSGAADIDYEGWGAFLRATTKAGPAEVGVQLGWSKGDDAGTNDKDETGPGKGADWNPALILMNDDLATWSGGDVNTAGNANISTGLQIINVFANYKVTPKFSAGAALTYAKADKVAANWDKDYGLEFDVTAAYKLYDNLTYMVGAGYLWTGDYYKKGVAAAKVDDDYILMNKLTLSF